MSGDFGYFSSLVYLQITFSPITSILQWRLRKETACWVQNSALHHPGPFQLHQNWRMTNSRNLNFPCGSCGATQHLKRGFRLTVLQNVKVLSQPEWTAYSGDGNSRSFFFPSGEFSILFSFKDFQKIFWNVETIFWNTWCVWVSSCLWHHSTTVIIFFGPFPPLFSHKTKADLTHNVSQECSAMRMFA